MAKTEQILIRTSSETRARWDAFRRSETLGAGEALEALLDLADAEAEARRLVARAEAAGSSDPVLDAAEGFWRATVEALDNKGAVLAQCFENEAEAELAEAEARLYESTRRMEESRARANEAKARLEEARAALGEAMAAREPARK